MNKIIFMAKQIIPFTYTSKYRVDGKKYLAVWKQWFYKPFNVRVYELR